MEMGKMMEEMMGGGGRQEVYPFLMGLPALTPEMRVKAQLLSEQRIREGSILLQGAHENLSAAILASDHIAAQQALQQLREGLGEVGSGVAVYKLLRDGAPPQDVALQWFKREMSLPTPPTHIGDRSLLDVSYVHLFTMALLLGLALAMVGMYFLSMRRAAALFGKLEPVGAAQPPGAAPALKGEAAPLSPADPPSKPVTAKWHGNLRVSSVISETPSVKTLRLSPTSGGTMPFTFAPGQFLNVSLPIGGARMNRSYSISSSPTQRDYVELTVKREPRGAVSRHLDDLLRVGDLIEVGGPVGRFTFDGSEAESIVLISGGVGITPMMSIARYLTDRSWPGDIFFLYACRAPADFIFAREIGLLQRANPKLHVTVVMERPEGTDWQGPKGRLSTQLLSQSVPDIGSRRIHLCGPPVMMDAVKALLAELKVPPEQVKTEDFGTAAPSGVTSGRFTAPATGPMVSFSKNKKASNIHAGQTVLELSEELGIGIDFACRVGTCGVCKVKLTAGEVDMAVDDGLDADDKAAGLILACQARPRGPVSVEA
jgi:ferredoxin-NADP reductase